MPNLVGDSSDANIPAVIGTNSAPATTQGDPTTGGRGVVGNSGSGIGVLGQCEAGVAVYGNSGTKAGIYGQSRTFQGVYGHGLGTRQTGSAGVVGESDHFDGVFGISHAGPNDPGGAGAGVSGHNPAGGFAGFFDGNVTVTGTLTAQNIEGSVKVTGTVTAHDVVLSNSDCAEDFDVAGLSDVGPGTVMVIDQEGALREGHEAYDKKVAGVVSGGGDFKPGIVLGKQASQARRMPIALVGRVYCKVDASYSPIEVGDLLTTSPTAGHAMKVTDPIRALGSVVGKALRGLEEGQGLIPILVALQ